MRQIPNSENTQRLLTVEQVMIRLSVCRSTVYELFKRGTLPRRRIGRAVRIPIAAVERLELGEN